MRRTTTPSSIAAVGVMWGALATTACTGTDGLGAGPGASPLGIGGGQTVSPLPNAGSNPGPGSMPTTTPSTTERPSGEQPVARMHRLTASQYANSLRDLLGADVPVGAVDPDFLDDGFVSVGASTVSVSPSGSGLYEAAATAATTWLFGDPARLTATLACVPQAATDTACAQQALSTLGRRAYRRPLSDEETNRLVTLATSIAGQAGSSMLIGMRHAVNLLIQSPNFLYRVELGAPSPSDGGRLKYTSFEMASRLASTLWNTLPDPTLLDAADSLANTDGVSAQAKRMLADPKAHQALSAFVDDLYALHFLQGAMPDPTVYPGFTDTLRQAMKTELELRVDDAVFGSPADFLSLFDSKTTFVNDELAQHYGLPTMGGSAFRRVTFPADSPRAGILGSGALLTGMALLERTFPTRRGKFIRDAMLCQIVPPPPSNVMAQLPPNRDPNDTIRKILTDHRASPACAGCHALMDPIGLGLEAFDGVGKYRTMDKGQPIDTTGNLDGVPFNGLAELGKALRNAPVAGPCLVSKLYTQALGRAPVERDALVLDALATRFAAGGNRLDQLLLDVVASDGFRFVEPTAP
ncbi:MAG TPA: DUF1592 domain-containing protein [Polyangiaceae bacterium]|nr:DUF1592 domain-containing protein [Polyangiaceae bacterium]